MNLKLLMFVALFGIFLPVCPSQAVTAQPATADNKPILVIVADKLDSMDVFESKHRGIKRLLQESAYGLLSIRSGFGYMKSNSGYLTVGSGIRSAAPDELSGLLEANHPFAGLTAQDFWGWNMQPKTQSQGAQLVVPELGWIYNQALENNKEATPGRLGAVFRNHGWKTHLYGNVDNFGKLSRPGGLLLMDREGRVDDGIINSAINVKDPDFPYFNRLDTGKVFQQLEKNLQPKTLVVVDFTDFVRLDTHQEEILTEQYPRLKNNALNRLGEFVNRILDRWSAQQLSLLVISPTLSNEAFINKRLLAPIIIRSAEHSGGILVSGTTNWTGIVSNIDLLPTLLKLARIKAEHPFDGRPVATKPSRTRHDDLDRLYWRINAALAGQRPILDWYLGLITVGWLLGYATLYFKLTKLSEWLLTGIATIPLTIIVLPLLPTWSWQVPGFLVLTIGLSAALLSTIPDYKNRFLALTLLTWLILVVDQATGWNLIRYSAMGYSPAAGARNYGMGNEYMGVFLPVALVLSHLVYLKTKQRWLIVLILGLTTIVLGLPNLGINFGGTLGAIIGFTFYLAHIYQWKLRSRKLWLAVLGGVLLVMALGYLDTLRAPEQQTHVGRFFGLIFSNRFAQVLLILQRKVEMNLKLLAFSPWARIVWLALGLTIVNRLLTKQNLTGEPTRLLWQGILVTGIAVFALNDSGIVALATGLAFAFSYLLIAFGKRSCQSV